jgi:hypothetical protein
LELHRVGGAARERLDVRRVGEEERLLEVG